MATPKWTGDQVIDLLQTIQQVDASRDQIQAVIRSPFLPLLFRAQIPEMDEFEFRKVCHISVWEMGTVHILGKIEIAPRNWQRFAYRRMECSSTARQAHEEARRFGMRLVAWSEMKLFRNYLRKNPDKKEEILQGLPVGVLRSELIGSEGCLEVEAERIHPKEPNNVNPARTLYLLTE
ncbi:MAG: hypothetical protein KW806_00495 [Candidatus Yanofskybacteria bacterium]|nr:hypothetical protein [Candidatus Yanofskybacteria bacterium]